MNPKYCMFYTATEQHATLILRGLKLLVWTLRKQQKSILLLLGYVPFTYSGSLSQKNALSNFLFEGALQACTCVCRAWAFRLCCKSGCEGFRDRYVHDPLECLTAFPDPADANSRALFDQLHDHNNEEDDESDPNKYVGM